MFEAKLSEGVVFKKIVDSIKDIVTDVNIDVGPTGIYPQFTLFRYISPSNGLFACSLGFPQSLC